MTFFLKSSLLCVAAFWCVTAFAQQPKAPDSLPNTVALFDGKTLDGWKPVDPADAKYWRVVGRMIVGGDGKAHVPKNVYLQTEREYGDFELRCLFRLSGDPGTGFINSGIQYRSRVADGDIIGYQADIGDGHWGDLYDEHRRGLLAPGYLTVLRHLLKPNGWNSYIVRVRGNRHELYINGVKTCDYTEQDADIPTKGVIAFQLHGGGAAKIELRDVTITAFKEDY